VTQPVVVLIGRQNVGKSTLFNRLCQTRQALMSPVAGTTRDWLEGTAHWGDKSFRVIDTGGYAEGGDVILSAVRHQVEDWVTKADATLWIVDGKEGLTHGDEEIARWLRRRAKSVTVVVNKIDDAKHATKAAEFHRLGFKDVLSISAGHGLAVNDLLDHLEAQLKPSATPAPVDADIARVAIIGRPNVGKSSLLNRLLGEERSIVSDIPGTTRDTVDTLWEWEGKKFLFMDTAGLRTKKSRASEGLEGLTRIMAEKALERATVALLLLDASQGLTDGDTSVALLAQEKQKAVVVGVNKWDVVQERSRFMKWYEEHRESDLPFLAWAPLVFLSAKTGQNVPELLTAVWNAHRAYHSRFDDENLTAFFWNQVQERPYTRHGKKLVFKSAVQSATAPPLLTLRGNLTDEDVHFSYKRHLENVFRRQHDIAGTPLVLRFSRRKNT